MSRFVALVLAAGMALAAAGTAHAVSAGKTIVFTGSPLGTVTFDGDTHKKAVASCKDCHKDGLFPKMKQGTVKITMGDITAGRSCGVCHNGVKAFEAKANCTRCHIKKLN